MASPAAAAPSNLPGNPSGEGSATDGMSLGDFYNVLVNAHRQGGSRQIRNVLSDITQTAVGVDVEVPDYVGQLWSGVRYQRKVVPLISGPALTSYTVKGWKWDAGQAPEVAAYAGDKADVPSNAVSTSQTTQTVKRLAGAHDIDRKHVDFNDTEFFQAYYEAMTDSYAKLSDAAAVTDMLAAATDQLAARAGANNGFLGAIADGVKAIDDTTGADSTFVIANSADVIPFVLGTTALDLPALLSMIGVNLDRIRMHSGVPADHVLVGTSSAVRFRELGGGAPIRVEAIDMTAGGVDAGVFGYYLTEIHSALGIQDVVIAP